jgi:hypothetical protein
MNRALHATHVGGRVYGSHVHHWLTRSRATTASPADANVMNTVQVPAVDVNIGMDTSIGTGISLCASCNT